MSDGVGAAGIRSDSHIYRSSGLRLVSEIALPGLILDPDCDDDFDVVVRYGPVPESLPGAVAVGPTWQILDGTFLVTIPGVARFLLTGGREIVVELIPGSTPQDVAIFLIGTVFGILLHQREHIVLHASAVRVGAKAVLFCGASGAGKSTIAAALGGHGFPLVTDDVCAVALDGEKGPVVLPDGAST